MKRLVLILMVITVAMAWPVGPAAADPSTAGLFKAMDKNKDGKLTAKEYVEACKQAREKCMDEFQWFDRNGDGGVTMPEYEGKVK